MGWVRAAPLLFLPLVGLSAPAAAAGSSPRAMDAPFDAARFKATDAYAAILEQLARPDPAVPGVTAGAADLDALLTRVEIEPRYLSWIRKYVSPVSRRKQRKRVRSVMHILLSKSRVKKGRAFARTHRQVLDRVSEAYDVSVADLVSMMNVESRFGEVQGSYAVAVVFVAHIAYLHAAEEETFAQGNYGLEGAMARAANRRRVDKRWRYSIRNLATVIKYARSRKLDPLSLTGSWAGAIGITQFMPASLRWAKDGDGDGRVNLSVVADAVASTANYLVVHGYRRGDLAARKKAFTAYNANREYVKAIVAYAERFEALEAR